MLDQLPNAKDPLGLSGTASEKKNQAFLLLYSDAIHLLCQELDTIPLSVASRRKDSKRSPSQEIGFSAGGGDPRARAPPWP